MCKNSNNNNNNISNRNNRDSDSDNDNNNDNVNNNDNKQYTNSVSLAVPGVVNYLRKMCCLQRYQNYIE